MIVKAALWLRAASLLALACALVACGAVAGMGQDSASPPPSPSTTPVPVGPGDRSGESGAADPVDAGDAERGAQLFSEPIGYLPSCSTCHALDESRVVGPGLGRVAERAEQRAGDQTASEYLRESIVDPSAYVVEGYPDVMPHGYGEQLDNSQLLDLIAYLLTLRS